VIDTGHGFQRHGIVLKGKNRSLKLSGAMSPAQLLQRLGRPSSDAWQRDTEKRKISNEKVGTIKKRKNSLI
jgi:hypothetical protein